MINKNTQKDAPRGSLTNEKKKKNAIREKRPRFVTKCHSSREKKKQHDVCDMSRLDVRNRYKMS